MTPELEKTIVSLVNKPNPTILDIGCNDGTDTLAFLSLFPDARIFSFEPDPRAAQKFRAKVDSPRAQFFSIAVGAEDGRVQFYQSSGNPAEVDDMPSWDLSGSIRKPKAHLRVHPWCTFEQQIEIPLLRLDTWAAEHNVHDVDFIWADMQGAEGDLIIGGEKTLTNTRYLYTEYSNDELYEGQPTLDQLKSMLPSGFELLELYQNDVLFRNTRLQ
jgi:FkbM family methyltransferase